MEVKAICKNARISAKKMRDVASAVRGMPVAKAIDVLSYSPKKGAYLINKTIKSAVANAENNNGLAADELVLKSVRVDEGVTYRRTMQRARGSANIIRKRTAHITVILSNNEG